MLRRLAQLIAVFSALCAAPVFALGLGEISVQSRLDQQFSAVIPIFSATPGQLDSLTVQIAGPEEFARQGIERADYLGTLQFKVVDSAGGPRIVISSDRRAHDPFLSFIVDARWQDGHLMREYTALLDPAPPEGQTSAPPPIPLPAQAETAPAAAAPAPRAPAAARPAPAAAPAPAVAAGGQYGPVAAQETPWSIATKLRPSADVTVDQMLLALYQANPGAFRNGRINGLMKGAMLTVPSAADAQATAPAEAKAKVEQLYGGAAVAKAPAAKAPAAPAAAAEAAAPPPSAPPKAATPIPKPTPIPPAPPAAAPSAAAPPPAAAATPAKPPMGQAPSAPAPEPPTAAAETPAPAAAPPAGPAAGPAEAPAAATPATPPHKIAPPPPENGLGQMIKIALVVAFLALIGLFAWRIFARKEAAPEFRPGGMAPKPAGKAPVVEPKQPPAPPKPIKLGDTTSLGAQAPAPAAEPPKPNPSATAIMEPALTGTAILEQAPKPKAPTPVGSDVDFDLTSQFEAQTLSINLDANDPLSEADFHLAYGLYDEAATLLKQALAKEPGRKDLRIKLAETYFAAGKPVEFQETAEAAHGQLSAADWQKIAIMGRQLCPDAALFKGDGAGAELAADVDLPLDELPAAAAPAPAAPAPPAESAPPTPPEPPKADSKAANVIDFDLDSELLKSAPPAAAPPPPAPEPESEPAAGEIDLSNFDLGAEPPSADDGTVEFNLDELDLSKPAGEAAAGGDEIGTKLDLARAYADMGDNEAARGLLNEVVAGGNAAQKQEAEALIKRLSA